VNNRVCLRLKVASVAKLVCLCLLGATMSLQAAPLATLRIVANGTETKLNLRLDANELTAQRGTIAQPLWSLGMDSAALRLGASGDCTARLWASVEVRDDDGDGRVDLDRGEVARVYVSATAGDSRSFIAALDIGGGGAARMLWVHSAATLPTLGVLASAPTVVPLGRSSAVAFGSGWSRAPAGDLVRQRGELLVLDADSGVVLPTPFQSADSIPGGVTALDIDTDGVTDRLYLTDASLRLWRLDLAKQPPRDGVTTAVSVASRVLAEPGSRLGEGVVFLFAPDIALARSASGETWLDISLGTSSVPGANPSQHHLVRLRDSLTARNDAGAQANPLRISRMPGPLASPLLTVAGHLLIATQMGASSACQTVNVQVQVAVLDPAALGAETDQVTGIAASVPVLSTPGATLTVDWPRSNSTADPVARCRLGDVELQQCPHASGLIRDYWRRDDAP
jgi:hypothetical protein